MTTNGLFTVRVERIASGGAGVARVPVSGEPGRPGADGGIAVFTGFTAPGDLARVRIISLHKNWAEAELVSVEEASPCRVAPPCPSYGLCGGCSLQHLKYEAQLAEKAAILKDALTRIGGFGALPEIKIAPSPPYGYRNRARLHRDPETGKTGFRGRKSGEIVPAEDCPVVVSGIRDFLKNSREQGAGAGQIALYTRGDTLLCGNSGGPRNNAPGSAPENTGGAARYPVRGRIPVLGREITADAGLFFQSNAAMLEKLIPGLLSAAEKADPRLPAADIYCGVGTFAVFLQDRFGQIDLVEENRAALALARQNNRGKCRPEFSGKDDDWVQETLRGKPGGYGFAVVDPPRRGLSRPIREYLAGNGPPVLAYVSCDPASLARDCKVLASGGYRLESLAFYDFYPQTAHIESLSVLVRGK
ncbi:MAG: class I SAM-dependent RNA methyltransferase [Treponema sp.]|nr:class I SAM-dependent RNA methyltransferase [Treponema sp.]